MASSAGLTTTALRVVEPTSKPIIKGVPAGTLTGAGRETGGGGAIAGLVKFPSGTKAPPVVALSADPDPVPQLPLEQPSRFPLIEAALPAALCSSRRSGVCSAALATVGGARSKRRRSRVARATA